MSDHIVLTIPEDISVRAREIAESKSQPVEQVLLDYLQTLPISLLPPDEQRELMALHNLTDDTLWTIVRDQMPDDAQTRAQELMEGNSRGTINETERSELQTLVERADRLMVRKAEAAALLKKRGYPVTQKDFKPQHE